VLKSDAAQRERTSAAARLIALWDQLQKKPGGRWLFSKIISFVIPYTGTVRPLVLEARPGYARVELRERRRVRNHLRSIHALALANVGEFTGGLAMTATAPANVRSILVKLEVEFLKKARGRVVAECHCTVPMVSGPVDHVVRTVVRDYAGVEVARIAATWRLDVVK
jgi:acyl-coenzyme A thioesterase PaaI-like protein